MLAEDIFRTRLHETIRTLRAWCQDLKSVADVNQSETDDFWGLSLRPHVATACSLELILYRAQRFDITIGTETYENRSVDEMAILPQMLASIAGGRAITRIWSTQGTGLLHSIETIVPFDGRVWQAGTEMALAAHIRRDACLATDRHYAPYRAHAAAA